MLYLLILLAIPSAAAVGSIAVQNTVTLQRNNPNDDMTPHFTFSEVTQYYYSCVEEVDGTWMTGVFNSSTGERLRYGPTGYDCLKVAVDNTGNLFRLRNSGSGGATPTLIEMLNANLAVVNSRVGATNSIKIAPNSSVLWESTTATSPSANLFALSTLNLTPLLSIAVTGMVFVSDSVTDAAGNIYAIGFSSAGTNPSSALVVKMGSTGTFQWSASISATASRPSIISITFNEKSNQVVAVLYSLGAVSGYACSRAEGCSVMVAISASSGSIIWTYRNPEPWSVGAGAVIDPATGDIFYGYTSEWGPVGFGYLRQLSSGGVELNNNNLFPYYSDILIDARARVVHVLQDRGGLVVANLPPPPVPSFSSSRTLSSSIRPSSSIILSSSTTVSISRIISSSASPSRSPSISPSISASVSPSIIAPTPNTAALSAAPSYSESSSFVAGAILPSSSLEISSSSEQISSIVYESSAVAQESSVEEEIASSSSAESLFMLVNNRASSSSRRGSANVASLNNGTGFSSLLSKILGEYLIVVIAVGLSIVIMAITGCIYKRKSRSSTKSGKGTVTSFSDTTRSSTNSHFGEQTVTNVGRTAMTATATAVNTDMGLALPGYLYRRPNIDYATFQELARGGGGTVYLARPFSAGLQPYGPTIIVKKMNNPPSTSHEIDSFNQEVTIMNDLRKSPYIATILGYSDNPFSIIMKYYELGSLQSFVKNPPFPVSLRVVSFFSMHVASGLQMIHSRGIAHCDIKLDNILLDRDQNGNLKCVITDFGVSCVVNGKRVLVEAFKVRNLNAASIAYASPETLMRLRDQSIIEVSTVRLYGDIYAWGMVFYSLLNLKKSPWSEY